MAKLKKPLFSLQAIGSLAKAISFRRSRGITIVGKKPEVPDAKTLAQLPWRHMYQKAVVLWHALSVAERQEWESLARPKHMTGFAWFISQALKPNPGLYLPLQGGRMEGGIDMAKHWIRNVRKPLDDQEPVTLAYFKDKLPAGPYTQGCRVFKAWHQSIPDGLQTDLIFDREDYDTDEMHDTVTNNERITIKTAGIYLITFQGQFEQNAVGVRRAQIRENVKGYIAEQRLDAQANTRTSFNISTLWQCVVGRYLIVRVWQDSGAPLDIEYHSYYSNYFMAQRVG
ncbi:unnamed protein product [marine sediment metagenome]|uniref:Uncharacterized protein n=1 Tax=marine sediment metagenome TaxID=412755 RepID=X1QII4_9ZZZZ